MTEIDVQQTKKLRGNDLIEAILNIIKNHPEKHYQGNWGRKTDCGTTACIAGWAGILTDTAHFETLGKTVAGEPMITLTIKPEYPAETFVSLGEELLGIDWEDASELFYLLNEEAAIYALEEYLKTGEFDWDAIKDRFNLWEDDEDDYDYYQDDDDEEDEEN